MLSILLRWALVVGLARSRLIVELTRLLDVRRIACVGWFVVLSLCGAVAAHISQKQLIFRDDMLGPIRRPDLRINPAVSIMGPLRAGRAAREIAMPRSPDMGIAPVACGFTGGGPAIAVEPARAIVHGTHALFPLLTKHIVCVSRAHRGASAMKTSTPRLTSDSA